MAEEAAAPVMNMADMMDAKESLKMSIAPRKKMLAKAEKSSKRDYYAGDQAEELQVAILTMFVNLISLLPSCADPPCQIIDHAALRRQKEEDERRAAAERLKVEQERQRYARFILVHSIHVGSWMRRRDGATWQSGPA
jgi:hypothetical protein